MNEYKVEPHPLSKIDKFFLKLLRASHLPVNKVERKRAGALEVLALYWGSLKRHPVAITLSLVAVVVSSTCIALIPYIFKLFLDTVSGPRIPNENSILIAYAVLIFIVGFITWVGWRVSHLSVAYLASQVMADLRRRAFAYLMEHSHQFFTSTFTGSLVQRVNRFAAGYDRLADRFFYDILPTAVQVSIIVYILAKSHVILAVVVVVWLSSFILWNYYLALWKMKYDMSRAAQDSKTGGQLADAITNQQTVELYKSQGFENELYEKETGLQALAARFNWQVSGIIDGVQSFFILVVEFLVLYIGIHLWDKGLMTVGMFVLVQTYIIQLSDKLWSFARIVRDVYESFADAKEMAEILDRPHDIQEVANPLRLQKAKGEIMFDKVSFAFNEKEVIKNVSFTIKPGEKVALVGASGAGKSTLVKLLFRQYDPTDGIISIDGKDSKMLTLASLRNALSLVPQDPALFHRTIMENIRYGRRDATDKEVIAAAKLAHCDEFVKKFPYKYETLVGERGVKLSGGERQRVAIARAFLRNSPILVLDEATSSLDSHSEERIQDALMKLMEGKTTVIIAHRLSTIRRMDRIIVLDDGKVIEDGAHDMLLEKGGAYAKLWNIQQGGFLKDEDAESS